MLRYGRKDVFPKPASPMIENSRGDTTGLVGDRAGKQNPSTLNMCSGCVNLPVCVCVCVFPTSEGRPSSHIGLE